MKLHKEIPKLDELLVQDLKEKMSERTFLVWFVNFGHKPNSFLQLYGHEKFLLAVDQSES